MRISVVVICLASLGSCYASSGAFCYEDNKPCGPAHWPGVCTTGQHQSPVNLPALGVSNGVIGLDLLAYKGNTFRMQNNGHSIAFDFGGQGFSNKIFSFEDPLNYGIRRQYRFASGHFHWGTSDYSKGSEHCVSGSCAAMELHLVHYLAKYASMADALASGDENALTVLGILIDVSPHNDPVQNLVDSVALVANADASGRWTSVSKPVDFSPWLLEAFPQAYTYKGSLTTPDCNEQVNWIVAKGRARTSHEELEKMRSIPLDGEGVHLTHNYRPLQPLNGRKVQLANVIAHP